MPTYKLPPLKRRERNDMPEVATDGGQWPDHYDRCIRIPVNKAIIDALEVGEDVEITLKGRLASAADEQREDGGSRTLIEVEVEAVEAYGDSEEDFRRGFKKGPKRANRYS